MALVDVRSTTVMGFDRVPRYAKTNAYEPYVDACSRLTLAARRAIRDACTEFAYPTQTIVIAERPRSR